MNFDSVTTNHNELELSDAELETVYGGGDSAHGERIHSYSVICDISLFSISVNVLNIVSIATTTTQVCINND